jgi:hypothetical protein
MGKDVVMTRVRVRSLVLAALVLALAVVVTMEVAGADRSAGASMSTLIPVADASVSQSASTTRYGTRPLLSVDGSPVLRTFVRFDLASVPASLSTAKLRLHVDDVNGAQSPAGGTLASASNVTWSESATNWNTRPAVDGAALATLGSVARNTWVEVDVTAFVASRAGGKVTFALTSTNPDGAHYDSRETSATAPQLVVTTGAPPPTVTGVTIAAVGDMVCPPGSATTATECRQQQVADELAADASVTQVLALGDLQYENGEPAGFQRAYDASYGQVKAKTRPVPGNHEYNTAGATGYFTYFGAAAGDPTKGYDSFDVGTKWHLVALNSNCSVVACAAGSQQEQWLRADLAASARPCTIAFWHHPRFSSGSHGDATTVTPLWSALADESGDGAHRPRPPLRALRSADLDRRGRRERYPRVRGGYRRSQSLRVRTAARQQRGARLHLRLPEARPRRLGLLVAVRRRGWGGARLRQRRLPLSRGHCWSR